MNKRKVHAATFKLPPYLEVGRVVFVDDQMT